MKKQDFKPHGPVSEYFMRHHYGPNGYVSPGETMKDTLAQHQSEYPQAESDRWRARKATPQDIIRLVLWELQECMYSTEPDAPKRGFKVDSWHAGACALRAYALMLNLQTKLVDSGASRPAGEGKP